MKTIMQSPYTYDLTENFEDNFTEYTELNKESIFELVYEGKYGSGHYYLVGEGSEQFILYDGDIDALYESTKASIPSLVDRMKDSRPEEEAVREYLKELDTPIPPDQIPERFK